MIYLRFQTILSIGLIVSTSAEINLDQVINYLSSKNLPKAQVAFHNCIAKFNVKGLEQTNYEEINTFLCKLRDNIISREMDPNEMSQKMVEYLKLDKSIITKHFDKCCTDFHSRLFTLENLGKSDNLETFAQQIYTRFDGAYKILQDCVDIYSMSGSYAEEMTRYEGYREIGKKQKFCNKTAEYIIRFITSDYTLNEVACGLKGNIFGDLKKPFAKYCFAVYYTYLVLDDSVLTGLIQSASEEINLDRVINYLSTTNLPKAQDAFHNCIANLNIKRLEKMNYEEINTFLCKLRDNIISREMDPNEMSKKLVEYLKLDKSIITENFENCCTDFHSRLFSLENFEKSENLKKNKNLLNLRYNRAYKILRECANTYSLDARYYMKRLMVYEENPKEGLQYELRKLIEKRIIETMSGDYTLYKFVREIRGYIFGGEENPFAEYCCATCYTFLALDDSVISGLKLSTSVEINLDRVINYLSTTNLPKAQDAFHNCIANLNIKRLEKMNYEEINKILYKLRDDLISRKIEPNEMSQKLVEFLKLDKSIITKKFDECCTIFHSRLFAVEKPQISDNLETFKELLEVRFYGAYKILQDCIDMYSLVELDKSEINFYEPTKSNSKQYNSQKSTINIMMNINSVDYTVDRVIDQLKFSYFGDVEKPFAMYCCAVYYTYLVSDDSNLKQSLGTSDRSQ